MGALYLIVKLNYIAKNKIRWYVIENSSDLVFYLINKARVALVPFSEFGEEKSEPWFRSSVGEVAVDEIKMMLAKLEIDLSILK